MNREEILKEIDDAMAELRDVKAKVNEALCHARNIVANEPQIPYSEAYNKGLEDAWELAKKIVLKAENGGLNYDDFVAIFGIDCYVHVLENMYPQEALAKLEAYEKEQNEIKVGDVVSVNGDIGIVTSFGTDNERIHILYGDGIVNLYMKDNRSIKKTGKHIDISSILEQIKE